MRDDDNDDNNDDDDGVDDNDDDDDTDCFVRQLLHKLKWRSSNVNCKNCYARNVTDGHAGLIALYLKGKYDRLLQR